MLWTRENKEWNIGTGSHICMKKVLRVTRC